MSIARERLRRLLENAGCTPAAPIFDTLSGRIAHMLGWDICKLSGSVAKAAELAMPDAVPMVNISDLVDICRRILRVADVSLIVDADDGGGGVLNVLRTVRELEDAGVAAIEIEDNVVPPRFSHTGRRHSLLVPKDEQVSKLQAAIAARRDPSTVIVARTSALNELPLDEALDRVKAYSSTADAIMLPGLPPGRRTDIEALRTVSDLPLLVLGLTQREFHDEDFLIANKIRVRYLGLGPYRVAVKAIYDSLTQLKAGIDPDDLLERQASAELVSAVNRTPEFTEWEQRWTRGGDLESGEKTRP